ESGPRAREESRRKQRARGAVPRTSSSLRVVGDDVPSGHRPLGNRRPHTSKGVVVGGARGERRGARDVRSRLRLRLALPRRILATRSLDRSDLTPTPRLTEQAQRAQANHGGEAFAAILTSTPT